MKKNIKKIINDLKEHIEDAPESFINALACNYRDYAVVVLTLEYYMMYETCYDYEEYQSDEIKGLQEKLASFIQEYVIDKKKVTKNSLDKIDELRNEIVFKTNALIKYTSKFYLYEYILNRLEYNFNEPLENSTIKFDDENFANRIVEYIFSNDDSVVINDKIRNVIGQLPVRMTKTKFYDLLRESFSIYNGSTSDGFDTYLDRIRTSASLFTIEENEHIQLLEEELHMFEDIDYLSINDAIFNDLQNRYRKVSKYIEIYTNFYTQYMNIINMTYVIMLSYFNMIEDEYKNEELITTTDKVLSHLLECYQSGYSREIDDSISSMLIMFEGVQEKSHQSCMILEQGISEGFLEKYSEANSAICTVVEDFNKCIKLTSNSMFMELEQGEVTVVDSEYISNEVEKLIGEFKELFREAQKIYSRAVMANVLSELPVFFTNVADVSEYVRNQIISCKNESEKMACYAIVSDMMEE